MLDLVRIPNFWFSHAQAHLSSICNALIQKGTISTRYKIFITNFRPTYGAYKDKAYIMARTKHNQ